MIRHLLRFAVGAACAALSTLVAAQAGKVEVQWLGQSTMKITTPGGKVIVIDPWLTSNPKTPPEYKKLEALGKVDLIVVSHAHFDHMADAPALSAMHKVPVYGPAGLADTLATLGVMPVEMLPRFNKGGIVYPLGPDARIKLIATHAEHSSEYRWTNPRPARTRCAWAASRWVSSSSWKTASGSTTWGTPGSSAT